jgi:hypothetical protein
LMMTAKPLWAMPLPKKQRKVVSTARRPPKVVRSLGDCVVGRV